MTPWETSSHRRTPSTKTPERKNLGELTGAPDNTDTDVIRVGVNHRAQRVVLKTTLRDVTVNSGLVIYYLRTGNRRYSVLQRLGTGRMFPAFQHLARSTAIVSGARGSSAASIAPSTAQR